MAGTREGYLKAKQTYEEENGPGSWASANAKGGRAKVPKGFAKMKKKDHLEVSRRGGQK